MNSSATDIDRPAPAVQGSLALATLSLWHREMVRFFRQRNRVIGALATPLMFWLVLGLGLNRSFIAGDLADGTAGVGYLEYFFPGTIILVLLFTAIFSTISVIEDRKEGFMQGVLVAPIPRLAIVLGKVFGGASIATLQGILFLLIWPLVGTLPPIENLLLAVVIMFITASGLTALGLCMAWPLDSTAAFHALMNLLLMPMWFLCGAVFPLSKVPLGMQILMMINPLTYGQMALSSALMGDRTAVGAPLGMNMALVVMTLASILMVMVAVRIVSRPRKDGVL